MKVISRLSLAHRVLIDARLELELQPGNILFSTVAAPERVDAPIFAFSFGQFTEKPLQDALIFMPNIRQVSQPSSDFGGLRGPTPWRIRRWLKAEQQLR